MQRVYDIDYIIGSEITIGEERFRIFDKIGGGGISEAFLARSAEQEVCVKILNPYKEYEGNLSNLEERFLFEAQKCMEFEHENVIKCLAIGVYDEKYYYYVMEYCKEGNLKDFIKKKAKNFLYDIFVRLDIIIQVCEGVKYIHTKGIHRDMKPDNILVSKYDMFDKSIQIKISDLGTFFDCIDKDSNPYTQSEHKMGSLMYISPEQKRGEELDVRTDIYSLGIVFAQILSNNIDDYRIHEIKIDSAIHYISFDVMNELRNIIRKMYQYDKSNRYQSIDEVIYDLAHKVLAQIENSYIYRMNHKGKTFSSKEIISNATKALKDKKHLGACHKNHILLENLMFDTRENWIFELYECMQLQEMATATESLIYHSEVITAWSNGYITANHVNTGELVWSMQYEDYSFVAAPVLHDNKLVLIDKTGKLLAMNLDSMQCELQYHFEKECTAPIIVIGDYYIIATNDCEVVVFDVKHMVVLKQLEDIVIPFNNREKVSAVYYHLNKVFVQYGNEIVVYEDIVNNEKWWWYQTDLPGDWYDGDEIITGMDFDKFNVYITTNHGVIVSLDINTGAMNWRIETAERISFPHVAEECLYFISAGMYVYYCNKYTGAIIHKTHLPSYHSQYSIYELINYEIYPFKNGFLVYDSDGVQFYEKQGDYRWNALILAEYQEEQAILRIPQMKNNKIIVSTPYCIYCYSVT